VELGYGKNSVDDGSTLLSEMGNPQPSSHFQITSGKECSSTTKCGWVVMM